MAATIAVLGIACLNLASLLLVRASARRNEFAVRLALGAGPARIVRQQFVESLILSLAGAIVGAALAYPFTEVLIQMASPDGSAGAGAASLPSPQPTSAVLRFHLGTTLICANLFGWVPGRHARIHERRRQRLLRQGAAFRGRRG